MVSRLHCNLAGGHIETVATCSYLGIRHLSTITHARLAIDLFSRTPAECQRCRYPTAGDCAYTSRVRQAYLSEEKPYADACCGLDSRGDKLDEPLPHSGQRENDEDESFEEDGRERGFVRNGATAIGTDDLGVIVSCTALGFVKDLNWSRAEDHLLGK